MWKALGDQLRRRPDGLYKNSMTIDDFRVERQNYATPHVVNRFFKMSKYSLLKNFIVLLI